MDTGSRKLTYLAIGEINPNLSNPRRHVEAQVRAIANSIEAFGFNAPLLIDRQNRIIAGHGRLEAAKILGLQQVPTFRLDDLSESQARAYMLADNRLTDQSSWDDTLLAVHFKELSEISLDFSIEATGFEIPEIDLRVQTLDTSQTTEEEEAFQLPDGSQATSRAGDLWLLGHHKIYCGSALDADCYLRLFGKEKASAAFLDALYNIKIDGMATGKGETRHGEFAMASGEMTESEFTRFLTSSFERVQARCKQDAILYACMDWRHMTEMLDAGRSCHFDLLNLCIWAKTNGGMGSLYRSQHELVFVYRNGRGRHRNNVQLGRFGRNRTNVWSYAGAN